MKVAVEGGAAASVAPMRPSRIPWRWVAIGIFGLSSTLNLLDRQLLAAVAPMLKADFGLSNADYGALLSAFSLTYMLMVPFVGLFIDRVGLNSGIMIAVTAWSLSGVATGFAASFTTLLLCRMALGVAETGGIPSASKANASYLRPRELGLGHALQAFDVSLGAIAAPLVAAAVVPSYGWRGAFVICGLLGLLWVPLWWLTSRRLPPGEATPAMPRVAVKATLSDSRMWGILFANVLIMALHSLWLNWTTIYLVEDRGLTMEEANRYFAWIPPVCASLGGFAGGWLAYLKISRGAQAVDARLRLCAILAPMLVVTAAIPLMSSAAGAVAVIGMSFFLCLALLTNLHVIPIDLFGARHAAFTASLLAVSYALLQVVLSPAIGLLVDRVGFNVLFVGMSVLPLVGVGLLRRFLQPARL